eukprot:363828-Chlamydomonas_euryale.AAC.17
MPHKPSHPCPTPTCRATCHTNPPTLVPRKGAVRCALYPLPICRMSSRPVQCRHPPPQPLSSPRAEVRYSVPSNPSHPGGKRSPLRVEALYKLLLATLAPLLGALCG